MNRERGSVSIVVAGALAFLAILVGLTADLGTAARARDRAQAAADASALAAAQELVAPTGRSPREVAEEYADRHGARLVSCRCDPGAQDVVVGVEIEVDLPAVGGSRRVGAAARAVVAALPGSEGLQPWFIARLVCLFDRVDGLWIVSGFRTRAEQVRLYREKPDLAAPPGHSNHELGLAADLGYPSPSAERAAHQSAAGCNLEYPMSYEPWHIEPVEI